MKKILFLLISLLVASTMVVKALAAQGEDYIPMKGVLVNLRLDGKTKAIKVATTDVKGQVVFKDLMPGKYNVVFKINKKAKRAETRVWTNAGSKAKTLRITFNAQRISTAQEYWKAEDFDSRDHVAVILAEED